MSFADAARKAMKWDRPQPAPSEPMGRAPGIMPAAVEDEDEPDDSELLAELGSDDDEDDFFDDDDEGGTE